MFIRHTHSERLLLEFNDSTGEENTLETLFTSHWQHNRIERHREWVETRRKIAIIMMCINFCFYYCYKLWPSNFHTNNDTWNRLDDSPLVFQKQHNMKCDGNLFTYDSTNI